MVDYLVVGLGLAGVTFCEQLEQHNKTFLVIDNDSQRASKVAGGMYNPVILNRFTPVWKAQEQIDLLKPFYANLEDKLKIKLDYEVRVLRIFKSVEEQNNWFTATDKHNLNRFLSPKILTNTNANINAPFGYGEVLQTGRVDTGSLIAAYSNYLETKKQLIKEAFRYDVSQHDGYVQYKDVKALNIVFTEGYGLKHNPFFNYLPLNGTKGELLTIKASDLKGVDVIKSSVFIIPKGDDYYSVGATYNRDDKTNALSIEAKTELTTKLESFLKCDYTVVEHLAGVRPTVRDRRPLVGRHPEYKNMYILNGFGSRGVMVGPYASKQLYDFIEANSEITPEMDIVRFKKLFV